MQYQKTYSKEDILKELDEVSEYKFFPDLEHGYFHTAGTRITLFADDTRWAIVFEKAGYANRGHRGEIELDYFGNCLINQEKEGLDDQYISNAKWIEIISSEELDRIETEFELVKKDIRQITVRDQPVRLEQDQEKYHSLGIYSQDYDNPDDLVDFSSLVRYIDEVNPGLCRATDAELRSCLPADLPPLFTIDQWHHTAFSSYGGAVYGEKPSSQESYQLMADVLVSDDISKWKPTKAPNNDWRNWPEAGGL